MPDLEGPRLQERCYCGLRNHHTMLSMPRAVEAVDWHGLKRGMTYERAGHIQDSPHSFTQPMMVLKSRFLERVLRPVLIYLLTPELAQLCTYTHRLPCQQTRIHTDPAWRAWLSQTKKLI